MKRVAGQNLSFRWRLPQLHCFAEYIFACWLHEMRSQFVAFNLLIKHPKSFSFKSTISVGGRKRTLATLNRFFWFAFHKTATQLGVYLLKLKRLSAYLSVLFGVLFCSVKMIIHTRMEMTWMRRRKKRMRKTEIENLEKERRGGPRETWRVWTYREEARWHGSSWHAILRWHLSR